MSTRRAESIGAIAGLVLAALLLLGASIALLAPEGTSAKVLIAVWLWALPVTGLCAAVGMLAGRLLGKSAR